MTPSAFELSYLNKAQQQAVLAPMEHMLIIAGAGSGKTRVLAERIAWLISEKGLSPHSLFAVTFTNKAAAEMRRRIEQRLNFPVQNLWIGTFHSLAHRLLRIHHEKVGLPAGFQILDSDDQLRLIKRIHKTFNLDEEKWPPKQSQWFIKSQKDEGRRSRDIVSETDFFTQTLAKVYSAYETLCQQSGLVDFDELLLSAYELFSNHPDVLEHYQGRFQTILVDEFQDTNTLQYRWLKLLTGSTGKIMAVGDDDQSIYSFRGAKVENMHLLMKDFPKIQLIRLEQNYRSTALILKAANAVISNNQNRLGKTLWTQGDPGEPISIYMAFNEIDEARYIIDRIQSYYQQGIRYQDIAILYRSNAQSRVLEEQCLKANLPYRIYGGQKFFERAEVKDALAYLRLIVNRDDDSAFERVVNTPTRGIGQTTLTLLRDTARAGKQSLWKTAIALIEHQEMAARSSSNLLDFLRLIDGIATKTAHMALSEQTDYVIHASGLLAHFQKDQTEKGQARVENLKELVTATQEFKLDEQLAAEMQDPTHPLAELRGFLAQITLETNASRETDAFTDSIQLMTLHSAKGLEFQVVFLCGLEEGLFPHQLSLQESHQLEEERRLCYVGITRSRKKLHLTYAEARRLYGYEKLQRPSRFLSEIPADCIQEVRARKPFSQSTQPTYNRSGSLGSIEQSPFKMGQAVQHPKFGYGVILNYEGSGEHLRLQVKFRNGDTKWLVAQFANLATV